jgi:hypothetical protein
MSFEYGLSSALNAVGFMHTMTASLKEIGLMIPDYLISTEIYKGFISVNPLAAVMILILMILLLRGIKESIIVNNILTMSILVFFQYVNVLSISIF